MRRRVAVASLHRPQLASVCARDEDRPGPLSRVPTAVSRRGAAMADGESRGRATRRWPPVAISPADVVAVPSLVSSRPLLTKLGPIPALMHTHTHPHPRALPRAVSPHSRGPCRANHAPRRRAARDCAHHRPHRTQRCTWPRTLLGCRSAHLFPPPWRDAQGHDIRTTARHRSARRGAQQLQCRGRTAPPHTRATCRAAVSSSEAERPMHHQLRGRSCTVARTSNDSTAALSWLSWLKRGVGLAHSQCGPSSTRRIGGYSNHLGRTFTTCSTIVRDSPPLRLADRWPQCSLYSWVSHSGAQHAYVPPPPIRVR